MKYIKLFEDFLFEIGDQSSKKYKYKLKSGKVKDLNEIGSKVLFTFTSDSGLEYLLELRNILTYISIDFSIDGKWPETNRGEMYRVMSTVSHIVEEVLKKNKDIRGLRYEPKGKGDDMGLGRDKLYRAFIKKAAKKLNKKIDFTKSGGTTLAIFK